MSRAARPLKVTGAVVFAAGLAAFAGILLIVLVNGRWPLFLKPVQHLFAGISDYVGDFALLVEGWLFLGPGLLLIWLGNRLEARRRSPR